MNMNNTVLHNQARHLHHRTHVREASATGATAQFGYLDDLGDIAPLVRSPRGKAWLHFDGGSAPYQNAPGERQASERSEAILSSWQELPRLLRRTLQEYGGNLSACANPTAGIEFSGIDRVRLVTADVTSARLASVASCWFEELAGIPVEVEVDPAYPRCGPLNGSRELVVFMPEGTLSARMQRSMQAVRRRGATLALLSGEHDRAALECGDHLLPLASPLASRCGQRGDYSCHLAVLLSLAMRAARCRMRLGAADSDSLDRAVQVLPAELRSLLAVEARDSALAEEIVSAGGVMITGQGWAHSLAQATATLLRDRAGVHAVAYGGGKFSRRHRYLMEMGVPVIALVPHGPQVERTLDLMGKRSAYAMRRIVYSDAMFHGVPLTVGDSTRVHLPAKDATTAPILFAIAMQLLVEQAETINEKP